MLVRLWWKEFRVFGPVWLILVLAAAVVQWLLFTTRSDDVRDGALTGAALCWAVLYVFAIASAAFSGERESNTLGFLDALPVGRATLWFGKSSFALASTILLVLVLVGMAELGTSGRRASGPNSWWATATTFAPILIEGLAWGLFWSAVSRNTLLAATMTVVSVACVVLPAADRPLEPGNFRNELRAVAITGIAALLAVGGSLAVLTWRPLSRRWSIVLNQSAPTTQPIAIRTASTGRSLFWQVIRDSSTMALLVAGVSLSTPLIVLSQGGRRDGLGDAYLSMVAALVAGVSVFGSENSAGSRQFLVNHGVKAGAVWWRRVLAWSLLMAAILGVIGFSVDRSVGPVGSQIFPGFSPSAEYSVLIIIGSLYAFVIGIVCGMAIRRRITAVLVGTMAFVALVPAQFALASLEMIPIWSLALIPTILLVVSAAWANDWLLEPEGFRPWIRLGLLIGVPLGVLTGSYIAYRGLGVADVGPVVTAASLQDESISPDQNGATLYGRAIALISTSNQFRLYQTNGMSSGLFDLLLSDRSSNKADFTELLKLNQPAIDLARQASRLPKVRFELLDRMTLVSDDWKLDRDLLILAQVIGVETIDRQSRGDLAGAWEDLMVQFRMANQLVATTPTIGLTQASTAIHNQAIKLAFEWLADSRQTPATINKALADLKGLPPLPNLSRCVQVESYLVEKALDLSGDELTEKVLLQSQRKESPAIVFLLTSRIICPPWERERARRVWRKLIANELAAVSVEPSKRPLTFDLFNTGTLGSPLTQRLVQQAAALPLLLRELDHDELGRRALLQAVALVSWKLDHGGKDAETLDELVPGLLKELPLDPYSGQPFGYVKWEGQPANPPKSLVIRITMPNITPKVGQRVLTSVGDLRNSTGWSFPIP